MALKQLPSLFRSLLKTNLCLKAKTLNKSVGFSLKNTHQKPTSLTKFPHLLTVSQRKESTRRKEYYWDYLMPCFFPHLCHIPNQKQSRTCLHMPQAIATSYYFLFSTSEAVEEKSQERNTKSTNFFRWGYFKIGEKKGEEKRNSRRV